MSVHVTCDPKLLDEGLVNLIGALSAQGSREPAHLMVRVRVMHIMACACDGML